MFQSVTVIVLVASITFGINLVLLANQSNANEIPPDTFEGEGPFDCWNIAMRTAKPMMKTFRRCTKEVKLNSTSNKDFSEKLGCIIKCTVRQINFTTPDYGLTKEQFQSFVKRHIKNKYLATEFLTTLEKDCMGDNGPKLDLEDEKCLAFADLALCLQSSLGEIIENSKYCIKKPKKNLAEFV